MVKCKDCIYWVNDTFDSVHNGIFGNCGCKSVIDDNVSEKVYKDKISKINYTDNPYDIKHYDYIRKSTGLKTNGNFGCSSFKPKNND